jgi:hypothetical protein
MLDRGPPRGSKTLSAMAASEDDFGHLDDLVTLHSRHTAQIIL